jgi:glycosyltransferase involved in cell wall biosynthesis
MRASSHESPSGTPLVSVVIPCFNQARFLAEAVESALGQTHPEVEVIVVDDESTDDTPRVAKRFPAVRYVWQRNQGLSGARNTGLGRSKGEYVVFLDADDRLLPRALEAGLECFRAHAECAFVFGDHSSIAADGSAFVAPPALVERWDVPHVLRLRRNYQGNNHYPALLQRNYIAMHAAVMYRRDALEAAGGFDQSLGACEDYDLYLRIARTLPVHYHAGLVAEYRTHGANMSENHELMLRTSLTVLARQRRFVAKDPALMEPYLAGVEFWKTYYGRELATDVRRGLDADGPELEAAVRGAITLLRYAPELLSRSRFPRLAIVSELSRRGRVSDIVRALARASARARVLPRIPD